MQIFLYATNREAIDKALERLQGLTWNEYQTKPVDLSDLGVEVTQGKYFVRAVQERLPVLGRSRLPDKAPRTLENTGTCPVCEKNVKLTKSTVRLLVDHGFKLPRGWQQRAGRCFGVSLRPYELSASGCEFYLKFLRDNLEGLQNHLLDLKAEKVQPLYKQGPYKDAYTPRESIPVTVTDPDWEAVLAKAVHNTETDLKHIQREIVHTQKKIDQWVLRPLPGES